MTSRSQQDGRLMFWLVLLAIVAVFGLSAVMGFDWLRRNAALQSAALNGNAAQVERLASQGADPNWVGAGTPPLILAATDYRVEAVRVLLKRGAQVDARKDGDGGTALVWVVGGAQMCPVAAEATARVLLEYGADVRVTNRYGESPLSWAREVSRTLKLDPGFYARANATYSPGERPPGSEVGKIPTARMEASRKALVAAILAAAERQRVGRPAPPAD
jgi:hypothetical protein